MKRRTSWCLLMGLLLGGSFPVAADILYSVTDLGTVGGCCSEGVAINSQGQVTGWSLNLQNPNDQRAFLYSNGQMQDLGTLGGSLNNIGNAINDAGQVAGVSAYTSDGRYHAFLYSNGQMTDLGTLAGIYSEAKGLNNAGQVVGWSDTSTGAHAFLYSNGQMTDLGTLGGDSTVGGDSSFASGLNNAGQVVGWSDTSTGTHAFLYSNGQMTDLGTLGGFLSYANGINNTGQVVGISYTSAQYRHAFLYSNGQMTDLGTLGGEDSAAFGISNAGQVVGYSDTFAGSSYDNYHAFLYSNGQMRDLNDLIDPALRVTLWEARAINDRGQIAANGTNNRAYLLTPIPEPSTLALFGIALLGLGAWVRRRRSSQLR